MNGHTTGNDVAQPNHHDKGTNHDYGDVFTPAPALASSRYNRQMLVPAISLPGQARILNAKVLIVGLGGLGSPAALYLAGAGGGHLGLLDNDSVELSNLHRQIVHRESTVQAGMSKVQSALKACRELNSEIKLVGHETRLDLTSGEKATEILQIFEDYDIVLDCTDNPATRYLISDLCVVLGKTLVSGAAQRLEGQLLVLNYVTSDGRGRGPCYRCVFPKPPSPEMVKGCGEIGIVGPVVGTIGTLMASEAIRLIVRGEDEPRKPSMLMYSAWPTDHRSMFRTIGLRGRRTDCLACGDEGVLAEKGLRQITRDVLLNAQHDYVAFCGALEDIKLLKPEQRVDAGTFMSAMTSLVRQPHMGDQIIERKWHRPLIVDTREAYEVGMGPQIKMSMNIPFSTIQRGDEAVEKIVESVHEADHDAVIFLCQQGNDSQIAAEKLVSKNAKGKSGEVFIGDVVGGFAAIEKVQAG